MKNYAWVSVFGPWTLHVAFLLSSMIGVILPKQRANLHMGFEDSSSPLKKMKI